MARSPCAIAKWNVVAGNVAIPASSCTARATGAWSSTHLATRIDCHPAERQGRRRAEARTQTIAWLIPTRPYQPAMV